MTDFPCLGHTGLANLGNTCYINTAIQCLCNYSTIVSILKEVKTKIGKNKNNQVEFVMELCDLIELIESHNATIVPKRFISKLQKLIRNSSCELESVHVQNDCSELILLIFDTIHKVTKSEINQDSMKKYNKSLTNFFNSTFNNDYSILYDKTIMITENSMIDNEGKRRNTYYESNIYMSLHMNNMTPGMRIEKMIERYFNGDSINGWKDDKTNTYHDVEVSKKIIKQPENLFVHLKRFTNNMKKIQKTILFDELLNLSDFSVKPCKYKLQSLVMHTGSVFGGHYYCVRRLGDRWLEYNDTNVHEISLEKVPASYVYCLCYTKM